MNFVDVEVVQENGSYYARRGDFQVTVPPDRGAKAVGREVIMGIRPEDISIADKGIAGEAYLVEPLGRDDLIEVEAVGGTHVLVLASPDLNIRLGDTLHMHLDTNKVQFFDPETEKSLLWN